MADLIIDGVASKLATEKYVDDRIAEKCNCGGGGDITWNDDNGWNWNDTIGSPNMIWNYGI